jgi:hypothetical protein
MSFNAGHRGARDTKPGKVSTGFPVWEHAEVRWGPLSTAVLHKIIKPVPGTLYFSFYLLLFSFLLLSFCPSSHAFKYFLYLF